MPLRTTTQPPDGSRSTVTGPFQVTVTPSPMTGQPDGTPLGRMVLDTRFSGDLDAVSHGERLAAMTATPGSAGYAAIEWMRGTLLGRRGTFMLQHSGRVHRGEPSLDPHVVPDSGPDELTGLVGTMTIRNDRGAHSCEFTSALPES